MKNATKRLRKFFLACSKNIIHVLVGNNYYYYFIFYYYYNSNSVWHMKPPQPLQSYLALLNSYLPLAIPSELLHVFYVCAFAQLPFRTESLLRDLTKCFSFLRLQWRDIYNKVYLDSSFSLYLGLSIFSLMSFLCITDFSHSAHGM